MPSETPRQRPGLPLVTLALFAALILAFGGSLLNRFVWEDEWLMEAAGPGAGARVEQLFTRASQLPPEQGGGVFFRPVTLLSLATDGLVWGRSPAGYHATSLLLHLGVALLVFTLCRRLLRGAPGTEIAALAASSLFIVHPALVGSVAYVGGRGDLLAALFTLGMLAILLGSGSSPRWPSLLVAAVLAALAAFSTEWGVIAPILLALSGLLPSGQRVPSGPERIASIAIGTGLVTGYLLLRNAALTGTAPADVRALSPAEWLLTLPVALMRSLQAVLWPGLLSDPLDHVTPVGSPVDGTFVAGLATTGALLALGALLWRAFPAARSALAITGLSFLSFTTLLPMLQRTEFAFPTGERFLYFTAACLATVSAFPIGRLIERGPAGSGRTRFVAGVSVLAVVFVGWSACSQFRTAQWRTPSRLFETLSLEHPGSSRVLYNLAVARQRDGRTDEAIDLFESAVRLDPGNFAARNDLGTILQSRGRLREAEEQFRAALEPGFERSIVVFNLAYLLQQEGRLDEAAAGYREAIRRNPRLVEAHVHLGEVLSELGDAEGSLAAYREAARIAPDHGEAHARYGAALASRGRLEEGLTEMTEGLRLDPSDPLVRNEMAAALLNLGRPDEALVQTGNSIALWPDNPLIHYNHGSALLALGRLEEAAGAFRKAIDLDPTYGRAMNGLGVTLSRMGENEEALAVFDRLIDLDPFSARAHDNRGIVLRALGRTDEARRAFESALRLDPSDTAASSQLEQLGASRALSAGRN